MTDNRTTELREKLTERGIEYTTNDHMGVCETSWNGFTAMQLTPNAKLMMALTPEQAIAATLCETYTREECEAAFVRGYSLGSLPVGSSPQWDENRQTVDGHMAELGWVRAATLGGGKLTAEQVREAVEESTWAETSTIREFNDSSWQAIADELNATLGSGTCELEPLSALDVTLNMLDSIEWGACSECGCAVPMDAKFCNECGKAVK